MDHPFGADQFYGNFNSWEDTKTWFAGVQQALGEKTSASFSFRRHSDLFVLFRDQPESSPITTPTRATRSPCAAARRCRRHYALLRRGGLARIHRQQQSGRPRAQPRGRLRRARFPRAQPLLAPRSRRARKSTATSPARSRPPSPADTGSRRRSSFAPRPAAPSACPATPTSTITTRPISAIRTYALSAPGPMRAGSTGPEHRVRGDITLFERQERDGIDYYRASLTDIYRAVNIQNLELPRSGSGAALDAVAHEYVRLPLHRAARHSGHDRRGRHQVHVQLPDEIRCLRVAGHAARQLHLPHARRRDRAVRAIALTRCGTCTSGCRTNRCILIFR